MMRFLKSFYRTLRGWFSKSGTHLDPAVHPNENLTRFILSRRHFSQQQLRVKAEAFMPYEGEVSVFRVDGLGNPEIWAIGSETAKLRPRTLYARGDIYARSVKRHGLDVLPDEPPLRHAKIVGWSDKAKQKIVALQLAAEASLLINISPYAAPGRRLI